MQFKAFKIAQRALQFVPIIADKELRQETFFMKYFSGNIFGEIFEVLPSVIPPLLEFVTHFRML
jgi:hypothetical protein